MVPLPTEPLRPKVDQASTLPFLPNRKETAQKSPWEEVVLKGTRNEGEGHSWSIPSADALPLKRPKQEERETGAAMLIIPCKAQLLPTFRLLHVQAQEHSRGRRWQRFVVCSSLFSLTRLHPSLPSRGWLRTSGRLVLNYCLLVGPYVSISRASHPMSPGICHPLAPSDSACLALPTTPTPTCRERWGRQGWYGQAGGSQSATVYLGSAL